MQLSKQFIAAAALVLAVGISIPTHAGSLENMERERALLLDSMITSELTPEKRQAKVEISRNRLIDLERLVLRDKSLVGKSTPAVRAASVRQSTMVAEESATGNMRPSGSVFSFTPCSANQPTVSAGPHLLKGPISSFWPRG